MGTVDLDLCVDRPPPTAHRVILSLTHSVNNGRDVVVLGVRIFFATYERSRRPAWGAHVCSRWVPPGKPVVQGFLRPGRMGLAFTRGPRCRGRHTWNAGCCASSGSTSRGAVLLYVLALQIIYTALVASSVACAANLPRVESYVQEQCAEHGCTAAEEHIQDLMEKNLKVVACTSAAISGFLLLC